MTLAAVGGAVEVFQVGPAVLDQASVDCARSARGFSVHPLAPPTPNSRALPQMSRCAHTALRLSQVTVSLPFTEPLNVLCAVRMLRGLPGGSVIPRFQGRGEYSVQI